MLNNLRRRIPSRNSIVVLSHIINDANAWFADPRIRIVYVSVDSARIIDGLPGEITGG